MSRHGRSQCDSEVAWGIWTETQNWKQNQTKWLLKKYAQRLSVGNCYTKHHETASKKFIANPSIESNIYIYTPCVLFHNHTCYKDIFCISTRTFQNFHLISPTQSCLLSPSRLWPKRVAAAHQNGRIETSPCQLPTLEVVTEKKIQKWTQVNPTKIGKLTFWELRGDKILVDLEPGNNVWETRPNNEGGVGFYFTKKSKGMLSKMPIWHLWELVNVTFWSLRGWLTSLHTKAVAVIYLRFRLFGVSPPNRSQQYQIRKTLPKKTTTVDGWNPAPVDRRFIPVFIGFHASQVVVWDFSIQQ